MAASFFLERKEPVARIRLPISPTSVRIRLMAAVSAPSESAPRTMSTMANTMDAAVAALLMMLPVRDSSAESHCERCSLRMYPSITRFHLL